MKLVSTLLFWFLLFLAAGSGVVLVFDPRIGVAFTEDEARAALAERLPLTQTINLLAGPAGRLVDTRPGAEQRRVVGLLPSVAEAATIDLAVSEDVEIAFREDGRVFVSASFVATSPYVTTTHFVGRIEAAARPVYERGRFFLRDLEDLTVTGDIVGSERSAALIALTERARATVFSPETLAKIEASAPAVLATAIESTPVYRLGDSLLHGFVSASLADIHVRDGVIEAALSLRALLFEVLLFLSVLGLSILLAIAMIRSGAAGFWALVAGGIVG